MRYHSLVVDSESLPGNIEITAWSADDEQVMALAFRDRPWHGVQFHPESVGTEYGKELLANFLEMAKPGHRPSGPLFPAGGKEKGGSPPARKIPFRELPWADPEAVFVRNFGEAPASFWLDGPGWGATCMGRAESVFNLRENPLQSFQAWHGRLGLTADRQTPWSGYRGGPVGQFDYEMHRHMLKDPIPSPSEGSRGQTELLGRWMIPEGFLAFDRAGRRAFAAWENQAPPMWLQKIMDAWNPSPPIPETGAGLPPFSKWSPRLPREKYIGRVRALQKDIAAGESYEACLTHAFSAESEADPLSVYRRLRRKNPAPYAAYFAFPDVKILSASPELFLELLRDGILRSRPIKGTRPRGRKPGEDAALREELANHPKELAENRMIVDLTRHDFSRVCALGSVRASSLFEIEEHPAVFQMVSEVQGRLDPELDFPDVFRACFPGGSMTGAPKERTMECLSAQENGLRGIFSGALGYFTGGDSFRLSMVIRTLENRGGAWRIGCGGAVLAESDPDAEWEEACLKARSVIDAGG